jgi:hypothetical protein
MKSSESENALERIRALLAQWSSGRLPPGSRQWLQAAREELRRGVGSARFGSLLSLASRHVDHRPLAPTPAEREDAGRCLPGWNPECWQLLDCVRVALVVARTDLGDASGEEAIGEAFRYADVGELCALYRSLALLPEPERFAWQAAEGCRSNMQSVFESIACDNPYPVRCFDDASWRQLIIKAVFIGAQLWRVYGLDSRLSPEIARMALDLVDERRSAGRPVPPALWLCLGEHAGERGIAALEQELSAGDPTGRPAALLALARSGARRRLEAFGAGQHDPELREVLAQALAGRCDQTAFAPFC